MPLLTKLEPYLYGLMRLVVGFLFAFHGLQKLFGLFGGKAVPLASQMGAAGIIESVGGLLVMIGLWAGPVAFICSGEMAVTYFQAHQPQALWPIENRGELAAVYCFVFLYIAARGSGRLSVSGGR
jgi:putative oxidoreductase